MFTEWITVLWFSVLVIVALMLFFVFVPIALWISSMASGVYVGLGALLGMRLRRIRPSQIIDPLIKAQKAGLQVQLVQLEAHFLAGGDVQRVINALIAAQRADIQLDFERAAAIDLAGREVLEAVQMSVNPKVISTPEVLAVTKDGIEVRMIAQITVRANMERIVGGAGEMTVIARVSESLVSSTGVAESHKDVLENPDRISKQVLARQLDRGTAYEIVSIDITELQIGQNIGAKLEAEQAELDKQIAQAKAEERRAIAIAQEQEMRARVERMRAKVMEAEARVPMAVSDALRSGTMGVIDYYQLKNIEADTAMRNSLSLDQEVDPHQQANG